MFKSTRRILFGTVGLIGVAVTTGTALTASNTIETTNAGQGVEVVSGFAVTDVDYNTSPTNEQSPKVDTVEFEIARTTNNTSDAVADTNAEVFVQLRATGSTYADWAACHVTAGHAVCALTGGEQMNVEDVVGISVVAYDTLSNDI